MRWATTDYNRPALSTEMLLNKIWISNESVFRACVVSSCNLLSLKLLDTGISLARMRSSKNTLTENKVKDMTQKAKRAVLFQMTIMDLLPFWFTFKWKPLSAGLPTNEQSLLWQMWFLFQSWMKWTNSIMLYSIVYVPCLK